MLNQSTENAIRRFFESQTPTDIAANFINAKHKLKTEPGTAKAWFCYWCYRNIKITTKTGLIYDFAPNGFSGSHASAAVGICINTDSANPIESIALKDIESIHIPDPSKLYQKLGIYVANCI